MPSHISAKRKQRFGVNMRVKKYLKRVAYIGKSDIHNGGVYYSRYDDSYITRVGMEDNVKVLAEREITVELTHGVGFSPKDKKWYGWSHRAIYGFKVGSKCKKGDYHYNGSSLKDQEEDAISFWSDDAHSETHSDGIIEQDGEKYFDIKWAYNKVCANKKLHNTIDGCLHHIKELGRGEWTAKTMEDAKQMAIDFNEGVS